MKISTQEVERIRKQSEMDLRDETPKKSVTHIMESSTSAEVVHEVASAVDSTPDVREDIVESIKARTSSGTYRVSSEEIADLIVRRALADKVR